MHRYLMDDQHYVDLYDLHTIEKCLSYYNGMKESAKKKRESKEFRKFNNEKFNREINKTASYVINIIKTKRYELFADPTIADAIMDRIIHNAYILPLNSKLSMRQVMAENTKKGLLFNEKED